MRELTLSIVVDDPHFGWVGFGLGHSNGCRICHRGHGCGWHHQGRHNSLLKKSLDDAADDADDDENYENVNVNCVLWADDDG